MVTKNYGLYHLIGMDALNIAHPATLVIDRERGIRYIYRGDNQHDRAAVSIPGGGSPDMGNVSADGKQLWLSGRYDNVAQAEQDVKSGVHSPHDKVSIIIIPTNTPRLGHHVFFAQEMAADNPDRVLSERMFSFDLDEERGILYMPLGAPNNDRVGTEQIPLAPVRIAHAHRLRAVEAVPRGIHRLLEDALQ